MSVNKYDKINNRLLPFAGNGGGGGSAGIRYDEENDVVQLFYDGVWQDWMSGGMAYPIGEITTFNYTNNVQKFTIPATGIWKLEVWGAKGGGDGGGKGGYSYGNANLQIGTRLNVVTGGISYNGGGAGGNYNGGGATHIALEDDLDTYTILSSYNNENTASSYVLIVAGGGGCQGTTASVYGGSGGGANGGSGSNRNYDSRTCYGGGGGSQSSGGGGGSSPGTTGYSGSFGQGGNSQFAGGGGGGWYGGGGSGYWNNGGQQVGGGGGGSGYVNQNKLIELSYAMENGINSGNGLAKLTFLGRGN